MDRSLRNSRLAALVLRAAAGGLHARNAGDRRSTGASTTIFRSHAITPRDLAEATPPPMSIKAKLRRARAQAAPRRTAPASSPAAASPSARAECAGAFAWPAQRPVISDFGAAAMASAMTASISPPPMDTPIHAAASGTVTYSGNELKDYGNLLLIKHDDGYVTAYAHADQLWCSAAILSTKGQVIGYSGQTGDVPSRSCISRFATTPTPVRSRSCLLARALAECAPLGYASVRSDPIRPPDPG